MPEHDDLFRHLYDNYYRAIVRLFVRFGFASEEARDLAQDTFVRVFQSMGTYEAKAKWSYLRTTAVRLALNRFRSGQTQMRNKPESSLDEPDAPEVRDASPTVEDVLIEQEQAARQSAQLAQAIEQLPIRLSSALLLRLRGTSYKEISSTLGITLDAVKTRLHEAKAELKRTVGAPAILDDDDEK